MARNYQTKQNDGGVDDTYIATQDGAQEYNSVRDEVTNAVTSAALVPSVENILPPTLEDKTQLAQSLLVSAITGTSFSDSGTSAIYDLTPVGSLVMPPAGISPGQGYNVIAGAMITFVANSTCSAAPELDIGPVGGPAYGPKPIKTDEIFPQPLEANDIFAGRRYQAYYDPGGDAWILIQSYGIQKTTILQHREDYGGNGGNCESENTWFDVFLNTIHLNELNIAVNTGTYTFTLPPGRYQITAIVIANRCGPARAAIEEVAGGARVIYSTNGGTNIGAVLGKNNPYIYLNDILTVTASTDYKLRVRTGDEDLGWVSQSSNRGSSTDELGVEEIYSTLRIDRIF